MDEKVKNIFLVESKKYFFKYINDNSIKLIYNHENRFLKIIRKIVFKFNLPFYNLFFANWKKKIQEYENVIILDTSYRKQIVEYIKKKNPKCKVIFYYWNLINKYDNYRVVNYYYMEQPNIDEFWSFNLADSQKYNLKYNPQFYTSNVQLSSNNIENDVFFIGKDKNRKSKILELENKLINMGIKTKFNIIENEGRIIPYDEYLKILSNSKVILDIINDNETGVTLRCMESIFLEKKLITNNKDIKNYDFYNKNNIFILGEDNFDEIKEFIKSDYEKIEQKIVDYYDYKNWIKRFNNI